MTKLDLLLEYELDRIEKTLPIAFSYELFDRGHALHHFQKHFRGERTRHIKHYVSKDNYHFYNIYVHDNGVRITTYEHTATDETIAIIATCCDEIDVTDDIDDIIDFIATGTM